jgi:mannosylglycerate hydrolase MGH1-like protein
MLERTHEPMTPFLPTYDRWPAGKLLAFSGLDGRTDYVHGLIARTVCGPAGIEIVHPSKLRIVFAAEPTNAITLSGDAFSVATESGPVRGAFLDTHHFLIHGPCTAFGSSKDVLFRGGNGAVLIGSAAAFDERLLQADFEAAFAGRCRWLKQHAPPAHLPASGGRTWCRALAMMKSQVYTAEGIFRRRWTTPDRWPHRDLWLWDSGFHAIGWRHIDPVLAREMIDAVFDTQRADGFVPHQSSPGSSTGITQPPILSFAARLVDELSPDPNWIKDLYPKLSAYVRWDLSNRDRDGLGLAEWQIDEDPNCRSGESGMDNSPRFDQAGRLDAVDFNSYLALECETLAKMSAHLGLHAESHRWRELHRDLCARINQRLWSDEHGFYFDYDTDHGVSSRIFASSGFLPLLCGAAGEAQAVRLAEHLSNRASFGTPLPVPSIAASDVAHYSPDLFRGPVWINVNWMIVRGLERYGLCDAAERLRQRSVAEIERTCDKYGVFFEYFDDRGKTDPPALLRKGKCAPEVSPYHQAIHDFGWTATLYLDWVATEHAGK